MQRLLILILTCLMFFPNLSGRNTHYSFAQLSIEEGLSQANVTSILLDSRGDLWVGTKNGLNRYVRQVMENFFHSIEDQHSLPDNHVLHLEEDSLGNIWVATTNGLAKYDREQKNFRTFTHGRVQSALCIEGGMLFGGDNVLYFYNYRSGKMDRIHVHPEGADVIPIEFRVQKILMLEDHKILLGTRKKGLFTYDCRTREIESLTSDFPNYLLFSVCVASDGFIYASFYGNGVYRFNGNGDISDSYTVGNSALSNNYVMDIQEHKGKLWLATDGGGINLIDVQTKEFLHLKHITGDKTSLPVNSITCLYKDYNGDLWAGSVRGGVFTIKDSYIKTYEDVVMNNDKGLTEKSICSIYEEKDGRLWIGTDGGGINLYDPKTDRFTHFPDTYGDKVVSIANLSDEELLVSIYTKGIFAFHKRTGNYRRFIVVDEKTNHKECFYGYLPLADQVNDDKIYIISYGAWVYHIKERKFLPLVLPEEYRKRTDALNLVYANEEFVLLKQGNLAFMANQRDDKVSLLFEADFNEDITSMTYDADNRVVWVGSNHGLGYYQLDEKVYKHFSTNLFNSVSYLTIDWQRRLWVCAENKLFSYNIKKEKFTSWNESDGYLPNEIQSKYQSVHGKEFIYLSGSQGLVRIATSIQSIQKEEPELYLSEVYYNGELLVEKVASGKLEIPWDYHSLALTFGVKSKDVFQKYLLKYTLRGASGDHSFESYDPQLNLSSLSPGEYTVFVSCYTKDGSESKPVKLFNLSVTPPWYQSVWFMTLLGILLIVSTWGIGHRIYQQKTRRMKGDVGEFLQSVLHSLKTAEVLDEEAVAEKKPLTESLEVPSLKPELSESDKAFLEKMDKLINDNLSNDELSAKFLTDKLAMSRASLYNKVKALTGLGVNDYINHIRIERSVHLLTHTDMSINDISYEVGFSYPRYFSTSFKQMKGVTPTKFRTSPHTSCPEKPVPDEVSSHSD